MLGKEGRTAAVEAHAARAWPVVLRSALDGMLCENVAGGKEDLERSVNEEHGRGKRRRTAVVILCVSIGLEASRAWYLRGQSVMFTLVTRPTVSYHRSMIRTRPDRIEWIELQLVSSLQPMPKLFLGKEELCCLRLNGLR